MQAIPAGPFPSVTTDYAEPNASAALTIVSLAEASRFTDAATGTRPNLALRYGEAMQPVDLTAHPADHTDTGTKVPEPATLLFVGTGLIGVARIARLNRPRWKFARFTVASIARALQHRTAP